MCRFMSTISRCLVFVSECKMNVSSLQTCIYTKITEEKTQYSSPCNVGNQHHKPGHRREVVYGPSQHCGPCMVVSAPASECDLTEGFRWDCGTDHMPSFGRDPVAILDKRQPWCWPGFLGLQWTFPPAPLHGQVILRALTR